MKTGRMNQFFLMATNVKNEIVLSNIDIEQPETFVLQTSTLAFTDAKNQKISFNQIIWMVLLVVIFIRSVRVKKYLKTIES